MAVGQASSGKLAKLAKRAELGWKVLEESGKRKPAAKAAEHLDGKDMANKRKKQKVVGERHQGVLAIEHAGLKKMQDKENVTGFFDFTSNNKGRSANASGTAAVAALLQQVKEERDRSPSIHSRTTRRVIARSLTVLCPMK